MNQPSWRIIIQEPGSPARRLEIDQLDVVIGRGADCDLCLQDPAVSGRHARLRLWDGVLTIEDLGSTNGTFIEGDTLAEERTELRSAMRRALESGETVTLGATRIEVLGPPSARIVGLRPESRPVDRGTDELGDRWEQLSGSQNDTDVEAELRAAPTHPLEAPDLGAQEESGMPQGGQAQVRLRCARLTLSGTGLQQVVDIERTPFVIGRKVMPGVDLVLRHERVSSPHLVIEYLDGVFEVKDLGSSNGTRINGEPLERDVARALAPDSALDIGPIHCLFSCRYGDDGRAENPEDYERAVEALIAEGLVTEAEYDETQVVLQQARHARHGGDLLLASPGTRLTVKRWLSALRRVRQTKASEVSGWKAVMAAASDWFGRKR